MYVPNKFGETTFCKAARHGHNMFEETNKWC